jgi:AraC-like DNA-binding protein
MGPGDIMLNPRDGGMIETGELAGLFCQIEHSRLQRTIDTLGGATAQVAIACSWILQPGGRSGSHADSRPLQTWATLIDQLLSQSDHLSPALGLDDQLYRLLAHALLQASGRSDALEQRHQGCTPAWNSRLDDLVDFIRSHLHLPLTLTDLQERSHYSGRHLQNLFREHLGCTPMQFVRRQRLATAMERLQTADADTSVTRISRDCGYRFTSHFSTDFQRQFGVNPSTVLRGSRRSSP